jgi:hypothetical protein
MPRAQEAQERRLSVLHVESMNGTSRQSTRMCDAKPLRFAQHNNVPRKAFQVCATYLSSQCPGHPINQHQGLPVKRATCISGPPPYGIATQAG